MYYLLEKRKTKTKGIQLKKKGLNHKKKIISMYYLPCLMIAFYTRTKIYKIIHYSM